jgi:imidazolonepropionase
MHRLITHASELLTGAGIRAKDGRRPLEEDLGRIPDGALVYREPAQGKGPGRVEWVGPTSELPKRFRKLRARNLRGRQAVIPGLVDCHTHLLFAGDRSDEFAARCAGATYQELAARGGGIMATVRATREAPAAELERLAVARLREARSYGVRTLEIKSGYGLSWESELKLLSVIPRLRKRFPDLTLTSTFLGAHDFPRDRPREEYLAELETRMIPEVARRGLADSCDVFVDQGYYTREEGRRLLARARELGLKTKVHADELADTGAARMAAEAGALSADHLLKVSDEGVAALARRSTSRPRTLRRAG